VKDREFSSMDKDGNKIDLVFKRPSQSQIMRGDFIFRKYFSEAIREGLLTNAEASKLLKDRNIWTHELDEQELSLRKQISELETLFRDNSFNFDDGTINRIKLKSLRDDLDSLTSIYSTINNNTAESVASEVRIQFYAAECSYFKDGMRKVFKDIEDFRKKFDDILSLDCYRQAVIVNYELALGRDLPEGLNKEYPEDLWLDSMQKSQPVSASPKKRSRKAQNT